MKSFLIAGAVAAALTSPLAAAERYTLDPSHSQIVFSYDHLGYSTSFGMFAGFEGDIAFDQDAPENSAVTASMPVMSMFTGWEARYAHIMSDDFFGAAEADLITFTSTGIEVTGEDTALITGDLVMNDITQSVVLDAKLNGMGVHPQAGREWAGFDATTTLLRSDVGLGLYAPYVGDAVTVTISVEAAKAE